MKTFILFFSFLFFCTSYSQNKKYVSNFIEKDIQSCRIQINDSISIFNIQYNLHNNEIKIFLKTENTINKKCINQTISNDFTQKININQNPIIEINKHTIKGLNITNFTNLIPNKLIFLKKRNFSIVVLELYSFSYSTVGSCYIYECVKLDINGKVIAEKKIESKSPIQRNKYQKIF